MSTLETIRARARAALGDEAGLIYPAGALDEPVRRALEHLNAATGAAWTLSGLDGALETTLPASEEGLLAQGAAAFAAAARCLQRAERLDLSPTLPEALWRWAMREGEAFEGALEHARYRALQTAAEPPYPPDGWPLEE